MGPVLHGINTTKRDVKGIDDVGSAIRGSVNGVGDDSLGGWLVRRGTRRKRQRRHGTDHHRGISPLRFCSGHGYFPRSSRSPQRL